MSNENKSAASLSESPSEGSQSPPPVTPGLREQDIRLKDILVGLASEARFGRGYGPEEIRKAINEIRAALSSHRPKGETPSEVAGLTFEAWFASEQPVGTDDSYRRCWDAARAPGTADLTDALFGAFEEGRYAGIEEQINIESPTPTDLLWQRSEAFQVARRLRAANPPQSETTGEAAGTRKVAAALYAQARANGKLYWQYRRSGGEHPWPLIAKELRRAYWNAAGIARVVGVVPGTPIEKGLEELHLTGKDVARMRHAVECWDEFHKREDSRPGSSWALAPLEIAEEQFRLLVADARASLSSLPQEAPAKSLAPDSDTRADSWNRIWGPVIDLVQKNSRHLGLRLGSSIPEWIIGLVNERIAAPSAAGPAVQGVDLADYTKGVKSREQYLAREAARRPSPETAGGRECWVLFDVDGIVRDVRGITERAWGYDKHGWTWRRMVEPPALVEGDKGPGGAG